MRYRYPDYYKEFSCVAEKCEATCCAGWEIVIDDESIDTYLNTRTEFGNRLCNSIDFAEGVFHQDDRKRCAFLNDENLCDIYTEMGEEYLCYTCTQYPRHLEEFEECNEISLSISCPEVAKMILNREKKVTFYEEEQEEVTEPFEEFDFLFYEMLEETRNVIVAILQNRTLPMDIRMKLTATFACEIQEKVNQFAVFEIDDLSCVYRKYEKENIKYQQIIDLEEDKKNRYELVKRYLDDLHRLEALQEEWPELLRAYQQILYQIPYGEYEEARTIFLQEHQETIERMKEQLMVYVIYSYYCGAVYDGEVLSKYQLAFMMTTLIEELWFAKYLQNGKKIDNEEMCQVVYRYAREIEHSDANLELLEEMYQADSSFRQINAG